MFLKQGSVVDTCGYLRVSERSKVSRWSREATRPVRRVLYLRRLHLEARVKKRKKREHVRFFYRHLIGVLAKPCRITHNDIYQSLFYHPFSEDFSVVNWLFLSDSLAFRVSWECQIIQALLVMSMKFQVFFFLFYIKMLFSLLSFNRRILLCIDHSLVKNDLFRQMFILYHPIIHCSIRNWILQRSPALFSLFLKEFSCLSIRSLHFRNQLFHLKFALKCGQFSFRLLKDVLIVKLIYLLDSHVSITWFAFWSLPNAKDDTLYFKFMFLLQTFLYWNIRVFFSFLSVSCINSNNAYLTPRITPFVKSIDSTTGGQNIDVQMD